ncbi:hypothetical protein DL768_007563 [Monosporascus sp. mg162]|nr:hypothetical protein DL768_007563 [Monosporascus sp. mg162]
MASSPPPPPPHTAKSASISRSSASREEMKSLADSMLLASLSSSRASNAVSPSYSGNASKRSVSDSLPRGIDDRSASLRSGGPILTPGSSTSASITREQLRASLHKGSQSMSKSSFGLSKLNSDSLSKSRLDSMSKAKSARVGMSAADSRSKVSQLKRDIEKAKAKIAHRSTSGLFKAAVSTDLLFLIDTTGSMLRYIEEAKNQVRSIANDIHEAFLNEAEVRIAVIGYKDHGDSPNIQFLDFTTSTEQVHGFLGELEADGGKDIPEDVLGGIQKALSAAWKHQTRCIVHIGDAPPHGRTLHDLNDSDDDYITPGSEPHRLTYEPLLRKLVQLNINYAMLRITSQTDRMALVFANTYAEHMAEVKLYPSNEYYREHLTGKAGGSWSGTRSKLNADAKLQFEESYLGTTYSALRHLIVKAVTASASRTATRLAKTRTMVRPGDFKPGMVSYLISIHEEEPAKDDISLETTPPEWKRKSWLDDTLQVEGFCPDVVVHDAKTLGNMMAHDDTIKLSVVELTIYARSKPFAQGATRVASYAKTAFSTNKFVVKTFKKSGGNKMEHLTEDMRAQALCKAFALEFNALLGSGHEPLDFIVTTALERKGTRGNGCISLEPYIAGEYIKYNSNGGWVNESSDPFNMAAQAFSHFTFERSWGSLLVSDLQGVGRNLTDPAIHTKDEKRFTLDENNLNEEGFKFFFMSHECNAICRRLELQTTREQCVTGKFQFRENWPTMDTTVCCSNKLCRKIVQLSKAHKSSTYPGHHWCDGCWPQLQSSMDRYSCAEEVPYHEFDVSKFFFESQGQAMPQKCPEHRETDPSVSSAATVGGSLWNRSKSFDFSSKKKSVSGRAWG